MTPHFYDPFDENAPSFLELNKRRRSCLAIAADALETNKKVPKSNQTDDAREPQRSSSFNKKARNRKWPDMEPIWNRRNQTNPEAYVIYVFLNGDGLCCRNASFTRLQLEVGGLPYAMELIAREYNARPKKLVRMDGSKVESIEELVTRGAYVLVQAGENFHECWYFLPDYAVDTSLSPERALVRRSSIKGSKETKSDAYALASASPGVSREQEVMP